MPDNPIICPSCGEENPAGTKTCGFCTLLLTSRPVGTFDDGTRIINDIDDLQPKSTVFAPGSLIANRYEILRELGRGGMGAVYLVADEKLVRKEMALKIISPDLAGSPEMRKRFVQEVLSAQELTHENIVKVFHLDEYQGLQFFTMEYLPGKSLREVMAGRFDTGQFFSIEESTAVLSPVLSALSHAHAKNVIHRDLKPENIIINGDFPDITVKVLDFGLARIMSPSRLTSTAVAMGTAYYMSPEQLAGKGAADHRTDLFSVGVIFYELLTGEMAAGRYELPSTLVKGLPRGANEIVDKALASRPGMRFQIAGEFETALSKLCREGVVLRKSEQERMHPKHEISAPAKQSTTPQRFYERRHFVTSLLGGVAALLLILGGFVYWFNRSAPTWYNTEGCPAPWIQKAYWDDIQDASNAEPFEDYLNRCPEGQYALQALNKTAQFQIDNHIRQAQFSEGRELAKLQRQSIEKPAEQAVGDEALMKSHLHYLSMAEDALMQDRKTNWYKAAVYLKHVSGDDLSDADQNRYEKLKDQLVDLPKPGEAWIEPTTGMAFIWVPGGCFEMGCGSWAGECEAEEKPYHEVCVNGLWIGQNAVTQGQWRMLMDTNPSRFDRGGDYPVESVSWNDAQQFIDRLNTVSPLSIFRLPTEAEWEYACRGGGRQEKYCGGNDVDQVAWHGGNSEGGTQPVGTKQPNMLNLYDMSGNVREWVQDVYIASAYASLERKDNPLVSSGGSWRVSRGGSWFSHPNHVRSVSRHGRHPDRICSRQGFRLSFSAGI